MFPEELARPAQRGGIVPAEDIEEKARVEETAARLGVASEMIAAACEVVTPERRQEQWRPEAGSPSGGGRGGVRWVSGRRLGPQVVGKYP